MRILFLTNFYPPHEIGGMGQSCQQVVAGLRSAGHETVVLTSMQGTQNNPVVEGDVYRLLYLEMDFEPWKQAFKFFLNRKKREQWNLQRFIELTNDWRPNLIFIWGMWNLPRSIAAAAEERYPGKVVYRFADYWPTLPSQYRMYWQKTGRTWYSRIPKLFLGIIARGLLAFDRQPELKFEHAICVSAATRDALVAAGVPVEGARVIHTGLDSSMWNKVDINPYEPIENGSLKLLYAGRIFPYKGIETALDAIKSLIIDQGSLSIQLGLAGSGPEGYLDQLHRKVARLGLENNVKFLGRFPQDDMPNLMHQYDVLLVPSNWEEPFARVVLEGMAAGLVVIGTRLGGTKEIIQHGINGFLVNPGDAKELEHAIRSLANSPGLILEISEMGKKTVTKKFTVAKMMKEIETYLAEVCDPTLFDASGEVIRVEAV